MSEFDEVLDRAVLTVERSALAPHLASVTVLRDLMGRVRLVIEFRQDQNQNDQLPPAWPAEREALRGDLATALGHYWANQIWRQQDRKDAAFLALRDAITQERRPWSPAGATLTWYKLERQLSKSTWTHLGAQPPWELTAPSAPAIVSFYSFKGGVGRTSAVAATAMLLAQNQKKVVALDLDLEAPGLSSLLLGGIAGTGDGIVDYLIERQVSRARPPSLSPFVAIQSDPTYVGSEPIRVLDAGRLNMHFIEKMARLDFDSFVTTQENPLKDLLSQIRDEYRPDFILLDVRSGVHDLGGLSLNGLSHLDVLFSRESSQGWAGLDIVLKILGDSRPRREVFVVHAQVPPPEVDPKAHERFLAKSYDLFRENYYTQNEQIYDLKAPEAPYGLELPFLPTLHARNDLSTIAGILTGQGDGYRNLARQIGVYLERETVK